MATELDFSALRGKVIPVWEAVATKCSEPMKTSLQDVVNWVVGGGSVFHPMLRGEGYRPSNKSIRGLSDSVIQHLGRDTESIQKWLVLLRQLIMAGNEQLDWDLELPPVSISAPREKGRFSPQRFHSRTKAQIWKTALHQHLKDGERTELDSDARIGQILLSAMLHGGLINTQLMIAFLKDIPAAPKYHHNQCYFDLNPTWSGHEDAEYRRWFPDLLTETLIIRFSDSISIDPDARVTGEWIAKRIKGFLKTAGLRGDDLPTGIRELCDVVSIQYELTLPTFLADYAKRKYLSHSLRPGNWERMQGYRIHRSEHHHNESLQLAGWETYPNVEEQQASIDLTEPDGRLERLKDALRSDQVEPAAQALSKLVNQNDASQYKLDSLLGRWLLSLLKPGKGSKAVKTSTARSYLSAIGTRLSEVLPDDDLLELSRDEFEEAYTLLLDDIDSKGLRKKVARALYQFHMFLEKHQHIVKIDYLSVLGAFSAPAPVDANLIWVDEYLGMQDAIAQSNLIEMHPDMVDIAQLILTLGYRCGLRRMEALRLRLVDLSGSYDPELLVRPFLGRRLKTNSSRRKIPLKALLTDKELKKLLEWKTKRVHQETIKPFSDYLFAIPDKGFHCVSEDLIFPMLHKTMRSVTGDQSLRYHHLRHSFGSLTLLKLMAADHGAPIEFFDQLPHQKQELSQASSFKNALIKLTGPTRKLLYAVARLLGHSGPDISLEHYIHTLDLLLCHQCSQHVPIPQAVLAAASGQPQATVYRWLAKGTDGYLVGVRKKNGCLPVKYKPPKNRLMSSESKDEDIWGQAGIQRVHKDWQILYLYSAFGLPLDELAERANTSVSAVQALIESAKSLAAEKTKGPSASQRFRFMSLKQTGGAVKQLLCPPKPSLNIDKALADELIARLSLLREHNPEQFKHGLDLYQRCTWSTRYQVVFKNTEDANTFLAFLFSAGVDCQLIGVSLLHGQRAEQPWIERGLKHWQKGVTNADDYTWGTSSLTDGAKMGNHGWLGVNVLRENHGDASPSFRFVMSMMMIIHSPLVLENNRTEENPASE